MCFEERFILNNNSRGNIIYNEHLIRYQLAEKFVQGKIVLDIACGSGFGAEILAQGKAERIIAIDIDEEVIKQAEKDNDYQNIIYRAGNAEKLEEKDNSFDVIVSFETIEHLKNSDKYLGGLKRVAKDEGLVLISTPNKAVFHEKNPFHCKEFTKEEFNQILAKYFKSVLLLEQANGLVTAIKADSKTSQSEVIGDLFREPLYFIAICSQKNLEKGILGKNIISLNEKALKNLHNNPGLKIADSIYKGLMTFKNLFKK